MSAMFAVLVLAVSRSRLVVPFSKHSYTLYILHFPLFLFVYFLTHRYWPQFLARHATAFAIAAVPFAVGAAAVVGLLESWRPTARMRRRPPTPVAVPAASTSK